MKTKNPSAQISQGVAALRRLSCVALVGAVPMFTGSGLAQTSTVGQWSGVQNWPIVAVHTILLPTGKVMFYPYGDDPRLWDPANNSITTLPKAGYNIFCTGHSFLSDGRVLLTGGHVQNGWGLNDASYYDPFANTWTRLPDMNNGRWYPSGTTLANGDQLITSGSYDTNYSNNTLPQVWQVSSGSWRNLTSAQLGLPLYPRTFLAPNGRVFFATSPSRYLDTAGAGSWTTVGNTIFGGGRDNYGSAVMYEPGKVLWAGGGDPPTATCERIDLNVGTPAWTATGSMPGPRRQNNLTILPDGRVLCTGGSASAGFATDDGGKPAVVWNPATGAWSTWATEQNFRGYHSCALLLPDGRVLSAGGDNYPNAQIFSPPYLFNGTRPTISSAPSSGNYGQTIFVGSPNATSITKVTLTRISSVTHAQNWDQRFLNLAFSQGSGGLNVTLPSSANNCPPGHYLLWILNGSGVPSIGSWLRVSGSPPATGGLNGEYYDAMNFTQRKLTRTDATVNYDWTTGSPDPSIGADTFSVRWTGQVEPQYSQTYTFYTRTDDGVRLWVNGTLLVDKWIDQGPTEWSGTIALTAATKYNIQMEYYENGVGAVAQLSWSSSSQPKQIIPQNRLFTTFSGIPRPWTSQDIGAVAAAGSSSYSVGNWTVVGSGADIWNNADEFRFVHQPASGDCEIIARVTGVQNTDPWAKAGVMIRESLAAGSTHAIMALTPGNGLAFQHRVTTNGASTHTAGGTATAPYWVRVTRVGSTFTGYKSTDGITWTTVGTQAITMGANIYIGLAVTSHLDGTLNTSTFDNVSATP